MKLGEYPHCFEDGDTQQHHKGRDAQCYQIPFKSCI